jgi:hypothetical protein
MIATALTLGACGGTNTMNQDMATPPEADMRAEDKPDLKMDPPDMKMDPPDMKPAGPMVMNLPTCADANVDATALYNGIAKLSCTRNEAGCHFTGSGQLTFKSAADMKTAFVDKVAPQTNGTTKMVYVKSGGGEAALHQSYVMYKLMGQAAAAGGSGDLMPRGAANPLANAQLCLFINWIKGGAQ